ncbi:MAG: hypothetical protein JOZ62_02925 [Acidobacteriaceae bacterium]|nr:hypothetical protein [Acidobacteriaceae bacterium]
MVDGSAGGYGAEHEDEPIACRALEVVARSFVSFMDAVFVLALYGYLWLNKPEYLTWWKRTIDYVIQSSCAKLPYPWGDRVESTLGNFGIWVQLSLAILSFRAVLGLALLVVRARLRG